MSPLEQVVKGGFCVGCGACAAATRGRISMIENRDRGFIPDLRKSSIADLEIGGLVCPFSASAADETIISREALPRLSSFDQDVGAYSSILAGQIVSGFDIKNSSSGGMTTWVLAQLLTSGEVDGVLHVTQTPGERRLFQYTVSTNITELSNRTKSQYYATSLAEVMESIRNSALRYAVVGVPCFIKSARLLARHDADYSQRLRYFVALVCGHLKTPAFAELMAWQLGITPQHLDRVDFRIKIEDHSAANYAFGAAMRDETKLRSARSRDLLGGDWGHALFQLKACDFCDDIFGDTADISFGDAWLPEYAEDWRGTNVVIIRNHTLQKIINDGYSQRIIKIKTLTPKELCQSQEGNFRHRRDGLSVRLADAASRSEWTPRKRIIPGSRRVSYLRKRIVRLRARLAEHSHASFAKAREEGSLSMFVNEVEPIIKKIRFTYWWMYKFSRTPILKNILKFLRII